MSTVWHGVHPVLEDMADELLRQSFTGVTRSEDRGGVLTPYMLSSRRAREVYPVSGTADPAMRRGMYHRSYNSGRPDLNSRDGIAAGGITPGRQGRGLQLQTGSTRDKERPEELQPW